MMRDMIKSSLTEFRVVQETASDHEDPKLDQGNPELDQGNPELDQLILMAEEQ